MLDRMRMWGKQACSWTLQDKHKAKINQLRDDVEKAFTEHPETTGETYPQHLWFTTKMAGRFVYTSMVIELHGLLPFLCVRTASNQIEQIYRIMKTRIPVKRREEIDKEIRLPVRTAIQHGQPRIAIVGGGFSGALAFANIVKQASGNLTVEWFESGESLGTGMAYGTKDPVHLLNVRTDRLGAFAGQAEGFWQWLQTEEGKGQTERIWPDRAIAADSFAPRMLYGEYLRHIVRQSLAIARDKDITVRVSHSTVVNASLHNVDSQQIMLGIERGGLQQETLVDAVVLATGNLPPRNFHFQTSLVAGERHYVENIWDTPEDSIFPGRVQELSADSDIVIIGSGLTMVDTVLTLRSRGYKGTITAISRNGLLPAPHGQAKSYSKGAYPAWDWVLAPQFAPRTALSLLGRLREEVKRAEAQGYDWRSVVEFHPPGYANFVETIKY